MVFLGREYILLMIFFWPLGAFGNVITPFIQNQAVMDGTRNTNFSCSSTPEPPGIFSWFVFPLGGDRILIAAGSRSRNAADFDLLTDDKESRLVVKIASVSRAGVCYCQLGADVHFAQLIVVRVPRQFVYGHFVYDTSSTDISSTDISSTDISSTDISSTDISSTDISSTYISSTTVYQAEEPTCKYTTNEKTPCEKISEMSCTVKYAANDSYVVPNMIWSTVGSSSKSLDSSIKASTSANITTAVSTLKLTKPENKESLSKFRCTTSFNLKDNLPDRFATNRPDYNKECAPDPDACTDEKPVDRTTLSKSGDKTTVSGNAGGTTKSSAKTGNNSTTSGSAANIKKPSGEGPDVKSKGDGNSGDSAGNSASGFSVGSSQRYIGIVCVVGIVGFFLVDV